MSDTPNTWKKDEMSFGLIIILLILICIPNGANSQEIDSETDSFEQFKDFFTIYPNKKAAAADSTLYKAKLVIAPVISYSPETSLGIGAGAKYLFKFRGSGEETRTSNMPVTLQYTLKNQFFAYSGFEIITNQEDWVIEGNLLVQNFPRLFYGLGRESQKTNEEEYDYFQVLVEPIFLKRMFTRYLFVGAGIRYNSISNVVAEEDGLLENIAPEGFLGSTSMGAEFAVLYDSRDNILNANRGWYFEFTHGFYGRVLGGTQEFQLTRVDTRYFFRPFKKRTDIIGLHLTGSSSSGDVPFSELALFGGDEILRGYIEGRYVDRNLLAGQVEYRANLIGRLGIVAFFGGGDVLNNLGDFRIGNLRASFGAGLRFLLDRTERLNIRADWGFGEGTNNLYLQIGESF